MSQQSLSRTMGRGLNLGGLAHGLVRLPATLRVNKVRGKDGVDERRLSKTGLTCKRARCELALYRTGKQQSAPCSRTLGRNMPFSYTIRVYVQLVPPT